MTSDIGPESKEGTCPRINISLADFISEIASAPTAADAFSAAAHDDVATYVGNLAGESAKAIVADFVASRPEVAAALRGLFDEVANGDIQLTIKLVQAGSEMAIDRTDSGVVVTLVWETT
jgi:hypothetical protein